MSKATLDASAWDAMFLGIIKATSNPTKILRAALATRGYRGIIEKFREQKGPDGAWEPRAASTQEHYAAIERGDMPPPVGFKRGSFKPTNLLLVLTGDLRKTLMPGALSRNAENVGRDAVLISSPLGYSGDLDEGNPTRNLPARPFMWLNEKELDETADIVLKLALGDA